MQTVIFDLMGVIFNCEFLSPNSNTYTSESQISTIDPQDPSLFTLTPFGLQLLELCRTRQCRSLALSHLSKNRLEFLKLQQPAACANFQAMILASSTGYRKNDPKIYHALADKLKLDLANTIFIDDTLENVQAAEQAGLQTVWCDPTVNVMESLAQLLK